MVKQPELDYEELFGFLNKNKKIANLDTKLSVDLVKHRMHKVAFDVYNVDNDPYDGLWRLESNADDGKEYLVRMDGEGTAAEIKTAGWSAISNENGTSITLAYKNVPIQRLSGQVFGFAKSDAGIFKRALLEKISNDDEFKSKILDMQSDQKKAELVTTFPELSIRQGKK